MTPHATTLLRASLVALGAVAYAILAHLSNKAATPPAVGLALSAGPIVLAVLGFSWRTRYRGLAWVASAAAGLAVVRYWDYLSGHFAWIYLLQQSAAYAGLALMFGRSLRADRVPLVTQWATLVHGTLPADAAVYTRRVTLAWTAFFVAVPVVLTIVFVLAPLPTWSACANFGVFPAIVAMFLVEYLIRRHALPTMPPADILAGVRAYLDSTRASATVPPRRA